MEQSLREKVKRLQARISELESRLAAVAESGGSPGRISPLAPEKGFPRLPRVPGVSYAACTAGIKSRSRSDVMLAGICPGSTMAGVFTQSATRSAAVEDCLHKLRRHCARPEGRDGFAVLVNSGNANAFTGSVGFETVDRLCAEAASILGIPACNVLTASTGVIGERLDESLITAVLEQLAGGLDPDGIADAARAIMTTDTFPKGAGGKFEVGESEIAIAGIAKGSGMIAPDMATMLSFVFTDAAVEQTLLQSIVAGAASTTYNAVSVDGDTSTSDTVLVAATGRVRGPRIEDAQSSSARQFASALEQVFADLAQQIARDGEGASKLVEVRVVGAATDGDADRVARSIANSPLVKTAVAGEDPNWGRIVMAVGKSGARVERDLLAISFGDVLVAERGQVAQGYREADGARCMRSSEILISVDLGMGTGSARVWTCDFTREYVAINADYRS
ncbi:MAG: bifunctional glutamate N-acetyltransferase/amino-acid acetyltransferase ArgJ [Rhodobacteraceae bacterium]|nr:bifunctional glutamate N-acetyltransferase/amino-acid acetyltransferase ArgJ [Paracoccaceae bacterium]